MNRSMIYPFFSIISKSTWHHFNANVNANGNIKEGFDSFLGKLSSLKILDYFLQALKIIEIVLVFSALTIFVWQINTSQIRT